MSHIHKGWWLNMIRKASNTIFNKRQIYLALRRPNSVGSDRRNYADIVIDGPVNFNYNIKIKKLME